MIYVNTTYINVTLLHNNKRKKKEIDCFHFYFYIFFVAHLIEKKIITQILLHTTLPLLIITKFDWKLSFLHRLIKLSIH